jgi:hypothetical protein
MTATIPIKIAIMTMICPAPAFPYLVELDVSVVDSACDVGDIVGGDVGRFMMMALANRKFSFHFLIRLVSIHQRFKSI